MDKAAALAKEAGARRCIPLKVSGPFHTRLTVSYTHLIAPIVSSGRAAKLILRRWAKEFGRTADFVVIEGCKACLLYTSRCV